MYKFCYRSVFCFNHQLFCGSTDGNQPLFLWGFSRGTCSLNPVVSSHRLTTTDPVFAAGRHHAPTKNHLTSRTESHRFFFRGFNIPRAVRTMSLMMSILSLWIVWHVFSNPTASMGRLYSYLHLPSQFIYHKHKRFMWVNIPFVPWMIWLFSKDLFKKTFYYMGLTTVWGRYIWNICMLKCFRPTIAADNGQLRPSQLKKNVILDQFDKQPYGDL